MTISRDEAAEALAAIQASQQAVRTLVRRHRGHAFLWIWGVVWILIAAIPLTLPLDYLNYSWGITAVAAVVSVFVGRSAKRHIRTRIDARFVKVLIALLLFAVLWPCLLGWSLADPRIGFAYPALVTMMLYITAGIWFDTYLLRIGILNTTVLLLGFFAFPSLFWHAALLAGVGLVGTGFYIRNSWR